jgi:large subunit ribosomal protein L28
LARRCSICGCGPTYGFQISHSNVHSKRKWYPNLQRARVFIDGRPRRVLVCTKCLKSNRVQRAV